MSRLIANRLGYTGFVCDCLPPVSTCWEAPVYNAMNGTGACDDGVVPINRFLNFPRKLQGETSEAPGYDQFHNIKDAIRLVYIPSGMNPDPIAGTYINLYKICSDALLTAPFIHACFPLDVCEPSEYVPGYLVPPVPFISFDSTKPGGGGDSDPGMSGITAVTGVGLSFHGDQLCCDVTTTIFERLPGENLVETSPGPSPSGACADTTDCPEE